jgi:hypothetical protein
VDVCLETIQFIELMERWDSAYADELEALASFLGDTVQVEIDDTARLTILQVECAPRTAANKSICFVACKLKFTLPVGYPEVQRPEVTVFDACGMMDEGLAISITVREFTESLLFGEFILFQIVERVIDCLDEMNDGECMICADSLSSNCFIMSHESEKKLELSEAAVKTACNHCFHYDCIAKWAAISLNKRRNGTKAAQCREKDDLSIRSSEGQLRSRKLELATQENVKTALLAEQADMVRCIDILNAQAADGPTAVAVGCTDSSGNSISKTQATSRLQKAKSDINFVLEKILKLEKR